MKRIPHKRRREQKTDYRKRLKLLKSGKVRLVIRKSLSHMRIQFIQYFPDGDKTIASAFSKELEKFGLKQCGNVPAAYLTGLLAGIRAKEIGIKEAVLDLGLQTSSKGNRLYAALKGVLDAGIIVPHSQKNLPNENRILGKHIKPEMEGIVRNIKEKILGG